MDLLNIGKKKRTPIPEILDTLATFYERHYLNPKGRRRLLCISFASLAKWTQWPENVLMAEILSCTHDYHVIAGEHLHKTVPFHIAYVGRGDIDENTTRILQRLGFFEQASKSRVV